jgi:glutaredoxin
MLKDYLDEKNVSYEEKMVDQDEVAKEEMMKDSGGFLGVPFTVITKEDGSKETVVGFDKNRINGILGLN